MDSKASTATSKTVLSTPTDPGNKTINPRRPVVGGDFLNGKLALDRSLACAIDVIERNEGECRALMFDMADARERKMCSGYQLALV
jgi:hypothetical protein